MPVLGRGLMARPKLMLLDEPSLGLSPLLVKEIFEILKRLNNEQKVTMLLVEQNARIALSISDYGYILENGRLVLEGTSEELLDNEDIKEFYLGLSLKEAECCMILTEWDEFKSITPDTFNKYMKRSVIVDGRRIYNTEMQNSVDVYRGIGLGSR